MKITLKLAVIFISLIVYTHNIKAQILDSDNKLTIVLKDGLQVTLLGQSISMSDQKSKNYFYLPTNPHLSLDKEGTPKFMLLKYMTEKGANEGGVSGALFHMLMEWGLTPKQQTELEGILKIGGQGARKGSILKGAVDVTPDGDNSFRIISALLSDPNRAGKVVMSKRAPIMPGAASSFASKMDNIEAQLMIASLEKDRSIADLSLELSFKYAVQMPAAKGRAIINWEKMHTQFKQDSASYSNKKKGHWWWKKNTRNYDEVHKFIETLEENKIIELKWEENIADDRISQMREAFFQFFLDKMSNVEEENTTSPPTEQEQEAMPDIKYGKKYTFNKTYFESNFQKNTQVFDFDAKLAVNKYFSVTGNLADWYDAVRDNEKCVNEVTLNDPFFEHRTIDFILDLDAIDIFEKEINYVTVNVRKKRKSGNDFNKHFTMDLAYLKENGPTKSISYAMGSDVDGEAYEYKIQSSLRGGKLFPENPTYKKADLAGITFSAPIEGRTVECEADLEELSALGVVRATIQLRYYKFGKEVQTNVPITVSKGVSIMEKTIFMDADTQGYAYQLIVDYKDPSKGKMAFGWQPKINDDYVYAAIPTEVLDENVAFIEKVIEAGKVIVKPSSDGSINKASGILDRFKDVINIVKN
ncbi:hypothetical protein [Aureibaculum luteum]|uniref:hypothetical protein n=1 Tax=Aureibaculum luteum TaxID=1548456 RepID=UPI000E4CA0E3|nr:hypothetical protein [Aureibaculum luteum]